jgi:hypothetical protein
MKLSKSRVCRHLAQLVGAGLLSLVLLVNAQDSNAQPAPARAQPPATSVAEDAADEGALERLAVTTAARKLGEVQRETDPGVIAAVPEFLKGVADNYPGWPVMYGAMNSAGGAVAGRGPPPGIPFPVLHHVTGAEGFFKYNVRDSWKQWKAGQLGAPADSPQVFRAWADAVTDGRDIPADMLNRSSTGARPFEWWSPDPRMLLPTASSREQGDDDFFALCHAVSLAPEWYPNGLVRLNLNPAGRALIRPVSFDGMTSPLWVQHPPNQPAATGGGALETLNKDTVRLDQLAPCQAYVLTSPMTAALKDSPSVNDYAPDLRKVCPGNTPESRRVAAEEIAIVRETRRGRRAADRAFREFFAKGETAPLPLALAQALPAPTPNGNGKPMGTAAQQLKSEMDRWARGGLVEHRGQRFPADRFQRQAAESPEAARAIERAAAELLAESRDARVLTMVAQLGGAKDTAFYSALLDRLEARSIPLPDAPGIRYKTLREDLLWKLAEPHPATDPTLSARARALLEREQLHPILLAHLLHAGSAEQIVGALGKVPADEADPWHVAMAGAALAKRQPDQLLAAAAHVAKLPPQTRALFLNEAHRAAPATWWTSNEAKLRTELKLPAD